MRQIGLPWQRIDREQSIQAARPQLVKTDAVQRYRIRSGRHGHAFFRGVYHHECLIQVRIPFPLPQRSFQQELSRRDGLAHLSPSTPFLLVRHVAQNLLPEGGVDRLNREIVPFIVG